MSLNFSDQGTSSQESHDELLAIVETCGQLEAMQRALDAVAQLVVTDRLNVELLQSATALCEQAKDCHAAFQRLTQEAEQLVLSSNQDFARLSTLETQATTLHARAHTIQTSLLNVYKSAPNDKPALLPYFGSLSTTIN